MTLKFIQTRLGMDPRSMFLEVSMHLGCDFSCRWNFLRKRFLIGFPCWDFQDPNANGGNLSLFTVVICAVRAGGLVRRDHFPDAPCRVRAHSGSECGLT